MIFFFLNSSFSPIQGDKVLGVFRGLLPPLKLQPRRSSRDSQAANVGCECRGASAHHIHLKQEFRWVNYWMCDTWCAAADCSVGRSMQSSAPFCGIEQWESQTWCHSESGKNHWSRDQTEGLQKNNCSSVTFAEGQNDLVASEQFLVLWYQFCFCHIFLNKRKGWRQSAQEPHRRRYLTLWNISNRAGSSQDEIINIQRGSCLPTGWDLLDQGQGERNPLFVFNPKHLNSWTAGLLKRIQITESLHQESWITSPNSTGCLADRFLSPSKII